jgi:hypothetical protein
VSRKREEFFLPVLSRKMKSYINFLKDRRT